MAKVTDLKLAIQTGTTTTLYASWSFTDTTTTTANTSTIKKGTVVKVKSGSKYYNGVDVPDWVEQKEWIVLQVDGDRVVIDKSTDGQHSICSAINAKNLTVVSGGGSSSSSTTTTTKHLDHFKYTWKYTTGDGIWFDGTEGQTTSKNTTWSYPSNARLVKFTVEPVSKKKSDGETPYWTGEKVSKEFTVAEGKPETPSAPNLTIEKYRITATLEGITDSKTSQIEFYIVQDNSEDWYAGAPVNVYTQRASYSCDVAAGHKYRACCRAINVINNNEKTYSGWSTYSNEVGTVPLSITNLSISVDSETSVKLSWTGCDNAKRYRVEYTTETKYFDTTSNVNSTQVEGTTAYITGLTSGEEWFFRVRAENDEGESGWSSIVSSVIGTKPDAPTTWSSTTTAKVGDVVTLYWTHNTEDGSKQRGAEIELNVGGSVSTITVTTDVDDTEEEEGTYSHKLNTSSYTEGAEIKWRVRTKGITGEYSDWSIQRSITLHAPPTLSISANSTITTLPYTIKLTAGPSTQTVLSYHLSIVSNSTYETLDVTGNYVYVNEGEEIYSKIYNVSTNPLTITLSAGDIILENGVSYSINATVSTNSGMIAEQSMTFTVRWSDDETYTLDASISIDKNSYAAYISPFCMNRTNYVTDDVTLSVYRRENDGSLKEIATGLRNDGVITVTDPHPALDYARYRIVAITKDTGTVYFNDLPGEPVKEHSIIIQWDERWSNFNYVEDANFDVPPWTGSLLRLRGNVDISESRNMDVSLIEYIGRKHPVSYYGTQRGETATWSTDIPKNDKDTIYALRRLSNWDGDVYVREPSGTGYWANIKVSFNITHLEVVIPVTLDITRVEGGI